MQYFLVKTEPFKYSWDQFIADKGTFWDGVRNYQARNNLKEMRLGDLVLCYHSNEGREVVGVAKVVKEHYPDPTTDDERWVAVDLEPVQALDRPVTLREIKQDPMLQEMALVRQGRLSVTPLKKEEFDRVLELSIP